MVQRAGEGEEPLGSGKGKNYEDGGGIDKREKQNERGTYEEYHNRNDTENLEGMEDVEVQRQQIRMQKAAHLPISGYYNAGEHPNGLQSSTSMAQDPTSGSYNAGGFVPMRFQGGLATTDYPTAKSPDDMVPRDHILPTLTLPSPHQKLCQDVLISDGKSFCSETLKPQEDKQLQCLQFSRARQLSPVNTPQYEPQYALPSINTRTSGRSTLQDYQMQLVLLEQQNKRRRMMSRQEQESSSLDGSHVSKDSQMQVDKLEQQNKKRLIKAGRKQELLSPISSPLQPYVHIPMNTAPKLTMNSQTIADNPAEQSNRAPQQLIIILQS